MVFTLLFTFSFSVPGLHMPARSPFTSARKTGTPQSLKDSASTFKVTVFPVPVAPAIIPCRFAILGYMYTFSSPDFPIKILLSKYMRNSSSFTLSVNYKYCNMRKVFRQDEQKICAKLPLQLCPFAYIINYCKTIKNFK